MADGTQLFEPRLTLPPLAGPAHLDLNDLPSGSRGEDRVEIDDIGCIGGGITIKAQHFAGLSQGPDDTAQYSPAAHGLFIA